MDKNAKKGPDKERVINVKDLIETNPEPTKSNEIHKGVRINSPTPFWSEVNGIQVSVSKLFDFLSERGFRQYNISKKMRIPNLVRIDGNIVEEVTIGCIVGEVSNYLFENNKRNIFDHILKPNYLFRPENLLLLEELEDNFLEDTRTHSYIPFKNEILEITPDEINTIPYEGYEKLIWRSQIIDHEITIMAEDEVNERSVFKRFIEDITSHDSDTSNSRFNHLRSLIGYLINTYKDKRISRAVVLMDDNLKGYPDGGTGKSLLANSISKIRETAQEDGKNFDPTKSFAFQQVNADTKILLIDDLKQGFNFERVFPLISEGLQIEKKYQDRYTIPFEKSPKLIITTNYAIQGIGVSFKRRLLEFELSSYFNEHNTPDNKYNQIFFDDWNKEEWDYFYSFMIYCCQFYLQNGIAESEPLHLNLLKVRETLGYEIADFFQENLEVGREYDKNELYNRIQNQIPDYKYKGQRVVTSRLIQFSEIMGYDLVSRHSGSQSLFTLKIPS